MQKVIVDYIKKYGTAGVFFILLIATLLPFFILSFYNHPSINDDYGSADNVLLKGFFAAQKYYYLVWTGRYFTDMLISCNPLVYNAYWAYKLNVVIWVALFIIAAYWLTGSLFKKLDKTGRIGISSLFIFLFFILMPDIGTGIYWQQGLYVCFSPDIMSLFLLGCIIKYYQSANKKRYFTLSCLLAVAIIGSYETNMVFIDLGIMLFVLFHIITKRKLLFPLTLLIVCIVFSLISIKAPGNSIRQVEYPDAHRFLFSIKESLVWDKKLLINFHWLPFVFFINIVLAVLLYKRIRWNDPANVAYTISPFLSLLLCVAIPFTGMFIYFWLTGQRPPLRTINGIWFYFTIGSIYFSFSSIAYIKKHFPNCKMPAYINMPVYLALFFILIFSGRNIASAYTDLVSGTAAAYNREQTARHNFLTTVKGDSCIIDSIQDIPRSFYFVELPEKPNLMNTAFWIYYHKKYIGIKGRATEPAASGKKRNSN